MSNLKNKIMRITFKEMEESIAHYPDLYEEISGQRELEMPLLHYLTEARQLVILDYQTGRLTLDFDKETVELDIETLHPAGRFDDLFPIETRLPDAIMRSYDNELYPWENDCWEHYDLGGDDDVDYNGTYLMGFNDALHLYLIVNKIIYKA